MFHNIKTLYFPPDKEYKDINLKAERNRIGLASSIRRFSKVRILTLKKLLESLYVVAGGRFDCVSDSSVGFIYNHHWPSLLQISAFRNFGLQTGYLHWPDDKPK